LRTEQPYNPLDKKNLGVNVADALLARPVGPLPPEEKFLGAGIYVLYYTGDYPHYLSLAIANREENFKHPIYVGKAVPKGARKGGIGFDKPAGPVLFDRLEEHAESIQATSELKIVDFSCRYLVVDDIWIPLGESLLIEMYSPVWNHVLDGYGNHDPGGGRHKQKRSKWDVVHPGRTWVVNLANHKKTPEELLRMVATYMAKKFPPKTEGER
jgi:hypothetical protein